MKKIIVPDYYKDFHCKCGACRKCCCEGWGITLSYKEYCVLLGIDCSRELRRKLDCAFFVLPDADNKRYAEMKQSFTGDCPLRRSDGLCALQCECGEEVLPAICKLYPRNVVFCALNEGSCANSCERVAEMLYREKKITFEEIEDEYFSYAPKDDNEERKYRILQEQAIEILQDRSKPLNLRFIEIGNLLNYENSTVKVSEVDIFETLFSFIKALEEYSPSFSECAVFAEEDIKILNSGIEKTFIERRYKEARKVFYERFPLVDCFFENLFVNHLIFTRFPYSQKRESIFEEYAELCGTYVVTKFVAIAYTERQGTFDDLIDCVSALFRCFEHSDAGGVIRSVLTRSGKLDYPYIANMLAEF